MRPAIVSEQIVESPRCLSDDDSDEDNDSDENETTTEVSESSHLFNYSVALVN